MSVFTGAVYRAALFMHEHYVNLDTVKYIVEANAEKVRKYRMDRGIEKNSDAFLNGSSDKETRSLIIHKDGTICTSSVSAKSLKDRAKKLIAETNIG